MSQGKKDTKNKSQYCPMHSTEHRNQYAYSPPLYGERLGHWNCHACLPSFNVLSGTIFEKTKIPLQKWFLTVGLVLNAKKSLSSCQLARGLDLNQKSAWYMQQRIRTAMTEDHADLLQGIVEADETYVGGKPRRTNKKDAHTPNTPRRGTKKTAVLSAV